MRQSCAPALLVAGLLGMSVLGGCGAEPSTSTASSSSRPPADLGVPVRLDGSPGVPVVNTRTSTLYVPVLCSDPSPLAACSRTASHTIDVIDIRKCSARLASGCRIVAHARAGRSPFDIALDVATDTLYVVDQFANTVSVLNGATCDAAITKGCDGPVATIPVGKFPQGIAFDQANRTVYVANTSGNSISVINVAQCNAITTSGCRQPVRIVRDNLAPAAVAVNTATDTVYVVNGEHTVSVFSGATCSGTTGAGCGQRPWLITAGAEPYWAVVDQATDTVYVPDNMSGTVSVINGASCNATVSSGCSQTPVEVATGDAPTFDAIDPELHTLFVANQNDNRISEINIATCSAEATSGCPGRGEIAPSTPIPVGIPRHFNLDALVLVPQTGTMYLVDAGGVGVLITAAIPGCHTTAAGCA